MSTQDKTHPVLCTSCQKPMDSPVCCAGCGALNPLPPSLFTYFELFGIAPGYEVDPAELRRKYLSLSRSIHPDVAGRDSDKVRRQSLELSSGLNRAYETLRDPVARAEYLLRMAGGPSAGDDKSVPGPLLAEIMMIREEIDEARQAGDAEALRGAKAGITGRHAETLGRIAAICRGESLADAGVQQRLRQELNAVKYWTNLLDQIPTQAEE
jgi:molecular chaperone HscB